MVKNPKVSSQKATIHYYDIGDYLNRDEKLKIITKYKSLVNLPFNLIEPNEKGDWLKQRSEGFEDLIQLAPDKKFNAKANSFFIVNTNGVVSGRGNWVNNFSKSLVITNVNKMLEFLNSQVDDFQMAVLQNNLINVNEFINTDETKIKWDDKLIRKVSQGKKLSFDNSCIRQTFRTPFCREIIYFNHCCPIKKKPN